MIKLSFVLPCYNVERYIADCLDSIYAQDMLEDEYEVICVNDCSTDGTRSIIVDYSLKHPNLTLIDHEQNMTVGGARNTGLSAAKGEFVWFVDPDDMVKLGVAKTVFEKASNENLDVLMFNFEEVEGGVSFLKQELTFGSTEVMTGQDYIVAYFPNRFAEFCIVWRNVFRNEFLLKNKICFPKMPKGEDVSFLWKVILAAKRVASVSDVFYTYRDNPYSVAKKTMDARVVFSERILFGNEICKLIEDRSLEIGAHIREDMEKTLRWCANSNLELISQMTYDERSRYFDEIVRNKSAVSRVRPYMNRKQKRIFSTFGGKSFWLYKIRLVEKLNRYGKVEH